LKILFVVSEYPGPWLNSPVGAYVVSNLAQSDIPKFKNKFIMGGGVGFINSILIKLN
jgi:hypothetical protein